LSPKGSRRSPAAARASSCSSCAAGSRSKATTQGAAYDTLLEAARLSENDEPHRAAVLLGEAIHAGVQLGRAYVAEAVTRLEALLDGTDALRELLVATGLLSAVSTAGDPGGRTRLAWAIAAADAAGALEESAVHLQWAGRPASWSGATTRRLVSRGARSTALVRTARSR
jgi:hypothetical protein